jgi:hypothetical protein
MKTDWIKVGTIGVDAGLCWLGDPCYIMGSDADGQPAKTWSEFCDMLGAIELSNKGTDKAQTAQWNYKLGHPGLGVSVSTGYGDGEYPVYIKRGSEGRIAEVKVVFI